MTVSATCWNLGQPIEKQKFERSLTLHTAIYIHFYMIAFYLFAKNCFTIDIHMIRFIRLFFFASFFAMPHWSFAQQSSETPLKIGESGREYLQAIRFSGIDSDVAYFDPSGPPPPMETGQEPKAPPEQSYRKAEWSLGSVNIITFLIFTSVLLAIAYVFARYGGSISVSLSRGAGNAARGCDRSARGSGTLPHSIPSSLVSILRLQDRREALIQLAQAALATAISADGVLLQRSWTSREALRHLPRDQNHMSSLRSLVHASERVHFGGRDVSEEEFQSHVDNIRPLFHSEACA
ncbi:DUF4129 domain-containing protein [Pseudovibrio sp. Tun.PSC04-5.I4]|uniref:DUF4129 domain-containing protein n=1 Tax=Pseudovibrio sp. Tun.PSC04-5.I4 TaxID=1798213 RepID=UPI00088BDAD5|nr:DUF4129 domain-containing protein [Pseudovibrio sp. Tun.PSC04-5.I4]SDR19421.1 protein of unknown function [Pseudovibrio sp. Tun.PSC04-5.I4]